MLLTEMNSNGIVITSTDARVSPQIDVNNSGVYVIDAAGALALTVAAPPSGIADYATLVITSAGAFAHTLAFAGKLADGAGHVNTLTFAAQIGATATLKGYKGKWFVVALQGVTAS